MYFIIIILFILFFYYKYETGNSRVSFDQHRILFVASDIHNIRHAMKAQSNRMNHWMKRRKETSNENTRLLHGGVTNTSPPLSLSLSLSLLFLSDSALPCAS